MSYIGKKTNSRVQWAISPVTKVKESKKKHDRNKTKKETRRIIRERDY